MSQQTAQPDIEDATTPADDHANVDDVVAAVDLQAKLTCGSDRVWFLREVACGLIRKAHQLECGGEQ